MARERFNKALVAAEIQCRIDIIQRSCRFAPGAGDEQVRGKDADTQRDYGEWHALRTLAKVLKLPHYPEGSPEMRRAR